MKSPTPAKSPSPAALAVALALAGDLPADTKRQLSEARRYAEGRGIRFPVTTATGSRRSANSSLTRPRRSEPRDPQ